MAFVKKTWKDRLVQYPTRRTLTDIVSGDTQTVNVARAEGTVSEAGDAFSAANMNDLEERIASAIESGGGGIANSQVLVCEVYYVEQNITPNPLVYGNITTSNRYWFHVIDMDSPLDVRPVPDLADLVTDDGTKLLVFFFSLNNSYGINELTIKPGDIFWEKYASSQGYTDGKQFVVGTDFNQFFLHTSSDFFNSRWTVNKFDAFVMGGAYVESGSYIKTLPLGMFATSGGSSGSEVSFTPALESGTPVGTLTIDGTPYIVYAPTPVNVVANPSGAPTADLTKLQIGNGIYGVTNVSANVAVSTLAAPLTTLKINDDEYTVPSGGGTTVVANPSGTATDDLEKIQIGNTIYDIPSGGGGSGRPFTCDLLFENDPLPSPTSGTNNVTRTYTLTQSIDDYDAVYVIGYNSYSSSEKSISHSNLVLKPDYYLPIIGTIDNPFELNGGNKDANRRLWFSFPTSTSIQTVANRSESNVEPMLYKVYGLKFASNYIYLPTIFSEEEREIGVWEDGKPLYQKTVDIGQLPSNTTKNVNHNIANIENIVAVFGFAKDSTSATDKTIPLPYTNASSAGNQVQVEVYNTYIQVATKITAFSTYYGKITIQYTKTTDTAGSGTWTPDGQLAHHYMTSEHIVGTWIDGSTIYERTWDFGSDVSLTANNWYDTSISNSGISLLTNVEAISANGNFRGQIEGSVNSSGSYIQLRSDGIASSVRYVTLQYTKA